MSGRQVLLYDPARTPANWLELMRPGDFAVFLLDVRTGAPLDSEGARLTPEQAACWIFPSRT